MARIFIIAALTLINIFFPAPSFLMDGGYWQRALSYSFFHASWWHLAVNSIAVWGIFRKNTSFGRLLLAYLIAIAVYPLALRPAIGFSNILYAYIGLQTPPLTHIWWRQKTVIIFLAVTLAMVFIPQLSGTTHIAALSAGVACAAGRRSWYNLTRDARRYY